MDNLIENTKRETERLLALLNDPHPGLFTWNSAVVKQFERLADLFNYVPKKK